MTERQECPEEMCLLKMREEELIAHLEWDHNVPRHKVEEMLDD